MVGNVGGLNNRLDVMMDYNINNAGNVNAVPHAGNGNGAPSVGQQIKTALQDFGNKVAEKFAAFKEKVGEGINNIKTAYKEWSAERSRVQNNARLDRQDAQTPAKNGEKFAGPVLATGFKPQISTMLSRTLKEIETAVVNNKDGAKTEKTFRDDALNHMITHATALTLESVDTDSLRQMSQSFRDEGRTEKAALLDHMIDKIEYSRTPIGAEEHFMDLAKQGMKPSTHEAETFLRSTANEGAAAVRKLMLANGAQDYVDDLTSALKKLDDSEEATTLNELMKKEGVTNTSQPMSRELAEALGAFCLKATDIALGVKIPNEMKDILGELTHEIRNDRTDGKENALTHKLYSDQLVLKCIGPAGSKTLSPAMKSAVDIITKVSSHAKSTAKMQPEMANVFSHVAPRVHNEMENFLVQNGMSLSAKIDQW